MKWLSNFVKDNITEGNDYKRTRQYNKLTPKMKRAVDMIFRAADKDADVISNFEKNVNTAAKQFGVSKHCLLYTSPSPRDISGSRMPSSA